MSNDWARPVVHWAIEATNPERQRAFYAALFHWNIEDGPIMNITAGIGGPEPGPGGHIQPGASSRISLYIQVRDLAETLVRTVELGGTVLAQPFQFPGTPTLASIEDPEGNNIMLVQQ
jgi:uncharacterized protein